MAVDDAGGGGDQGPGALHHGQWLMEGYGTRSNRLISWPYLDMRSQNEEGLYLKVGLHRFCCTCRDEFKVMDSVCCCFGLEG